MNEELKSRLKNALVWTSSTVAFSLVITIIMVEFERAVNPHFQSWSEIIWWWVLTVTTLGYNDIWPVTFMGRLLGVFIILAGLILLGIVISEISALIRLIYEHKEKGIVRIKYENHIVIYGYTSLTAGMIKLLRKHYGTDIKILLISNDVETYALKSNSLPYSFISCSDRPVSSRKAIL